MRILCRSVATAICSLALISTTRAERRLSSPDLETATCAARIVIDGELVESWSEVADHDYGRVAVWHVRVRDVLLAEADAGIASTKPSPTKPGDVLAIAGITDRYEISPDLTSDGKLRPLAAGDRLVLFVARKDDRYDGASAYGHTSAEWVVPDNAMWYVAADHAYGFAQYWGTLWWAPRQPMMSSVTITLTPRAIPGLPPLTLADLERRVAEAVEQAPRLQALIDGATAADVPKLLEICRARRKPLAGEPRVPGGKSHWVREASAQVGEVADAPTLLGFFQRPDESVVEPYLLAGAIERRADCREGLLQLLEGRTLSAERTAAASEVFRSAGADYRRDLRDASAKNALLPNAGAFARRLAAIAIRTGDEDLSATFESGIRDCIEDEAKFRFAALDADLAAAADVLVDAWPTLAPRRRFDALVTLRLIDAAAAARVAPNVGPFLSQLEVERPAVGSSRRVRLAYRWRNLLAPDGPPATLAVVYRDVKTNREHERPIAVTGERFPPQLRSTHFGGQFGSRWQIDVDLPPEVTAGTYDAFLRTRVGDATLGDGIACRLDVP